MANLALVKAKEVRVVESIVEHTAPLGEALNPGDAVRFDVATGKFTGANGTTAAEARIYGVLCRVDGAGASGTAIRLGVLDGFNLSAPAYDAAIYLSDTDKTLGDTAGTVSTVIGRVIPGHANVLSAAADKLLYVDVR